MRRADMHGTASFPNVTNSLVGIEFPCGAGAPDSGCKFGPARFKSEWERLRPPPPGRIDFVWRSIADVEGRAAAPQEIVEHTTRGLARATQETVEQGRRFVVIGGDHSSAIGTWSGVARALGDSDGIGLIWIDAHMDMHVPETSPSGAIHGMAAAVLLGHGMPQLTRLAGARPALTPDRICLVGSRSFEAEEVEFVKHNHIHVIDADEVFRRGIDACLDEAHALVTAKGKRSYGLSLDLDVFNPTDAPGVGTPVPNGLRVDGFLKAWRKLVTAPDCIGFEIVEYNPLRDRGGQTLSLLTSLVSAAVDETSENEG